MSAGVPVRERLAVRSVGDSSGIFRPTNDRLPRGAAEMTIAFVVYMPTLESTEQDIYDGLGGVGGIEGFLARIIKASDNVFSVRIGTGASNLLASSGQLQGSRDFPGVHVGVATVSVAAGFITVYANGRPGTPVAIASYGAGAPTGQTFLGNSGGTLTMMSSGLIDFGMQEVALAADGVAELGRWAQRDGGLPEVSPAGQWDMLVRSEDLVGGRTHARTQRPAGVDMLTVGAEALSSVVLINGPPDRGGVPWGF